jgi:hypothetical protein
MATARSSKAKSSSTGSKRGTSGVGKTLKKAADKVVRTTKKVAQKAGKAVKSVVGGSRGKKRSTKTSRA